MLYGLSPHCRVDPETTLAKLWDYHIWIAKDLPCHSAEFWGNLVVEAPIGERGLACLWWWRRDRQECSGQAKHAETECRQTQLSMNLETSELQPVRSCRVHIADPVLYPLVFAVI